MDSVSLVLHSIYFFQNIYMYHSGLITEEELEFLEMELVIIYS